MILYGFRMLNGKTLWEGRMTIRRHSDNRARAYQRIRKMRNV